MQTNQHASNHPVRVRKTERTPDDGYAEASENERRPQHENSSQPYDSDRLATPPPGRQPERSDRITTRYRR